MCRGGGKLESCTDRSLTNGSGGGGPKIKYCYKSDPFGVIKLPLWPTPCNGVIDSRSRLNCTKSLYRFVQPPAARHVERQSNASHHHGLPLNVRSSLLISISTQTPASTTRNLSTWQARPNTALALALILLLHCTAHFGLGSRPFKMRHALQYSVEKVRGGNARTHRDDK